MAAATAAAQAATFTASRLMKTYELDEVHVTSPVTIRNLDLLNTTDASSRCLDTRSLESLLTIENVTMTVDNQEKQNQVFNIGGNVDSTVRITNDDSRFVTNGTSYCFISFNTIDMTVTDSYFEGWCAIYLKGIMEGDHGTSNSVVDVRDSTIRSFNDAGYDPDIPDNNSFGAIVLRTRTSPSPSPMWTWRFQWTHSATNTCSPSTRLKRTAPCIRSSYRERTLHRGDRRDCEDDGYHGGLPCNRG